MYEINSLNDLKGEVFSPIVHLIRYGSKDIDQVIADINATIWFDICIHMHRVILKQWLKKFMLVMYTNRNMIGAQVGCSLCGQGLSGTGPKAGPNYLPKLCHENITINTVAVGGNVTLMSKS